MPSIPELLTTSTVISRIFHWLVALYSLPDAHQNLEKKTMKYTG